MTTLVEKVTGIVHEYQGGCTMDTIIADAADAGITEQQVRNSLGLAVRRGYIRSVPQLFHVTPDAPAAPQIDGKKPGKCARIIKAHGKPVTKRQYADLAGITVKAGQMAIERAMLLGQVRAVGEEHDGRRSGHPELTYFVCGVAA